MRYKNLNYNNLVLTGEGKNNYAFNKVKHAGPEVQVTVVFIVGILTLVIGMGGELDF